MTSVFNMHGEWQVPHFVPTVLHVEGKLPGTGAAVTVGDECQLPFTKRPWLFMIIASVYHH